MTRGRMTGSGNVRGAAARLAWLLGLLAMLGLAGIASAAGRLEGVASCAGSTCHGRAEGNGKVVRQDEILHWQDPASRAGAHSRAYTVLGSPRGMGIASALGLGAATSAPACLGCHATTGERAPGAQLSDGVTCEGCHGAASGWIASHYTVGASHAANVAAGMRALDNPQARASLCLNCHFGSDAPGQFVTHAMMAAGHPRVVFELDLFSSLQQHWDDDADYQRRKGGSDSVRLWAVGQASAVQRSVALFTRPGLGSEGLFPEFYFFDCHSCHRGIDDRPDRRRTFETNPGRPAPFGLPPYNDENMIMLSAVGQSLAPGAAAQFDIAVRAFHASIGKSRAEAVAAANRLHGAAGNLAGAIAGAAQGGDAAMRVVAAIGSKAISPRFTDYTGSAQAVMAVDTLLNAMVRDGQVTVGAAAGIRANLNRAYAAVESPATYNPPAFRAALGQAVRAIEALR